MAENPSNNPSAANTVPFVNPPKDKAVDETIRLNFPSEPPKQVLGGFEIIVKLGQGGMGSVFKARQPMLDRVVALKVMAPFLNSNPDFVNRFIREASSAANLSHPNMVQVHTAGEDAGRYYIAMEFVEGESLKDRIVRDGAMKPSTAVAVTINVATALNYAWQKAKLVHRDIKPDNIFLSNAGEVKVGDLGLAKSMAEDSPQMTSTGMVMGTPHYMSPEQVLAERNMDFRSDMYSLGATLFHMLTGTTPYSGDSAMAVTMKHVSEPPPSITKACPNCPHRLAKIVTRMMAKKPSDRYQSYDELITELTAVYNELPKDGQAAVAPEAPANNFRINKSVYIPAAIALFIMVAGLCWWIFGKHQSSKVTQASNEPSGNIVNKSPASNIAQDISALPAEEQVKRVVARLKELNPSYDGDEIHKIEGNEVAELMISTMAVTDISPVKVLTKLKKLAFSGDHLSLSRGLPKSGVLTDLSPLKGMQLTEFGFGGNPVSDMSPLEGMPLTVLWCMNSKVRDLSPLRGMPLTVLGLDGTEVSDLSPLKGMPLQTLFAGAHNLRDFSALVGMPLQIISFRPDQRPDLTPLRSIPTLQKINGRPAAEFWQQLDAAKPGNPSSDERLNELKKMFDQGLIPQNIYDQKRQEILNLH